MRVIPPGADNPAWMPGYDAREIVTEVGEEWPDLDELELEDELDVDPEEAA